MRKHISRCTSAFKNHIQLQLVSENMLWITVTRMNDDQHRYFTSLDNSQGVTMNSLLAAVLDLASQDLFQKRVKNNIPEMHWKERVEHISGSWNNNNQSLEYHPNNKLPPDYIQAIAVQSKNNYFLGKQNCVQNVQM